MALAPRLRVAALGMAILTGGALLTGCVPGLGSTDGPGGTGGMSLERAAAELATPIDPNWEVDVEGILGEPAILGDYVAVYSATEVEDSMRIRVYSLKTGELAWEHAASTAGEYTPPLFEETQSVGRTYPIPTLRPLVAQRDGGTKTTKQQAVVVYFERVAAPGVTDGQEIMHVADLGTGEDLPVTVPGYDLVEDFLDSVRPDFDDPNLIVATPQSPGRPCGDGPTFCFDEPADGYITLDVGALEAAVTDPIVPADGVTYSPEWGVGYAHVVTPETEEAIARIDDGTLLWQRLSHDIFEDDRTSPPGITPFRPAQDLVLLQGYQQILVTPELGNQLDLDYAASRTVAALDPETGETAWTLPGGDQLCYLLANAPRDPDADVQPMCLATGGSFSYTLDTDAMITSEDPVVSVVGVDVADGSIAWELEHAGDQSVLMQARQLDAVFDSRTRFAAAVIDDEAGLVDLSDGSWEPAPDDAGFVCKSERPGILPTFSASVFASSTNLIALEYPAGWYSFPCDADTQAGRTWTAGAVRTAGWDAGDDRRVIVTEDGLAAFTL